MGRWGFLMKTGFARRSFDAHRVPRICLPQLTAGGAFAFATSILLITAILDYATGIEFRVFLFYAFAIGIYTWYLGKRVAILAILASMTCWLLNEYVGGRQYERPIAWVWNAGITLAALCFFAFLTYSLRLYIEALQKLANFDELTGLLNRHALMNRLEHTIERSRRRGHPVSVAFLDLDRFKEVNDTRGHRAGDQILRELAQSLHHSLRRNDMIGRMGGDEFAVVFPHAPAPTAQRLLERLAADFSERAAVHAPGVTISVGVVTFTRKTMWDAERALRAADELMYKAKASRNGAIVVSDFENAKR